MSVADRTTAALVVARWQAVAAATFGAAGLDVDLALALCAQESGGDQYAVRVERGFWSRYGAAVIAAAKRTVTRDDDRWMAYPDLASASYGLWQVMYPVALEVGMLLRSPVALCDPRANGEAAVRVLLRELREVVGLPAGTKPPLVRLQDEAVLRRVLLGYNGGANAAYDDEVIAWRALVREARTAENARR